jgi:hypothetical protein
MIILAFLLLILNIFTFLYTIIDIALVARNDRYQKRWDNKKALRIRIDPAITRAELCELYVEFCKKYDCKVEY